VYGGTVLAASALFAMGRSRAWAFERELFVLRASGWCSLVLLLLALCASPVGRVARAWRGGGRVIAAFVPAFRRALGISAAALATLHGALALRGYLADSWAYLAELTWARAGLLAWAILAALWITSYPRAVAGMRVRAWKPLHRLAYAAAFFAFQHALLAPLAPSGWVLGVFGAALAVGVLRFVPRRALGRTDGE
jgi:DMSO/TMAO reductase YedYZ heme-binding membrane subunit